MGNTLSLGNSIFKKTGDNEYTLQQSIHYGQEYNIEEHTYDANFNVISTTGVNKTVDRLEFKSTNISDNIVIDGNGFVIDVSLFEGDYYGMFANTSDHTVTIKNLGIVGTANVIMFNSYFFNQNSKNVIIDNCFVDGELNNAFTAGFSVNPNEITIKNSFSKCKLNNNYTSGFITLSVWENCEIDTCYFAGEFSGKSLTTGFIFVLDFDYGNINLKNSFSICNLKYVYQSAMILMSNYNLGNEINIENCYSTAIWDPDYEYLVHENTSGVLYVYGYGSDNHNIKIKCCYTLNQNTSLQGSTGIKKIFNYSVFPEGKSDQLTDMTVKFSNNYISHLDETNGTNGLNDIQLLLDASSQSIIDTLLPNTDNPDISSSYIIDVNSTDVNITANPIGGFFRFFPMLRNFRINPDADGQISNWNWNVNMYQNMNSEPRQTIFLNTSMPYKKYLDNSTFVDANFEGIAKDDFNTENSVLTLVQNLDEEIKEKDELRYRMNINVITELSYHEIYGYTYGFNDTNTVFISLYTPPLQETKASNASPEILKEYHLTYELVGDIDKKMQGRYEIYIQEGYEAAFVHSTNLDGKYDIKYNYSGSSISYYDTVLNQKDADGNTVSSSIKFCSGVVYLNILGDFGNIDIYLRKKDATYSSLGKFVYSSDTVKLNNHIENKIYTITHYASLPIENIMDSSQNKVDQGLQQITLTLFRDFLKSVKSRGIDTYIEVIDSLHKTRTLVNNDFPEGVEYSLLDIILDIFPQQFTIYKYTKSQIIQESFRDSDITEKQKYYLQDLTRIYNQHYRVGKYIDNIYYNVNLKSSIKTKLQSSMNDDDFVKNNNIYKDNNYDNIDDIDELASYSEKLKLFESLNDRELNEYLKRVNTENIPNLLTYYPPVPESELDVVLDKHIADVPEKVRYDNYNPNYIFIDDVSNILQQYKDRVGVSNSGVISSISNTNLSTDTDIQDLFTNSTLKIQTISKNGQYYCTYLIDSNGDNKLYVFKNDTTTINGGDYINLDARDISSEISINNLPQADNIERIIVSNTGKQVLLYTNSQLFLSVFELVTGTKEWTTYATYELGDFHSDIQTTFNTNSVGLVHLNRDGSKMYIVNHNLDRLYIVKLDTDNNIGGVYAIQDMYGATDNIYAIDDIMNRVFYIYNSDGIEYYDISGINISGTPYNSSYRTLTNWYTTYPIKTFIVENGYFIGITKENQGINKIVIIDITEQVNKGEQNLNEEKLVQLNDLNIESNKFLESYDLIQTKPVNVDAILDDSDSNNKILYFTLGFQSYDGTNKKYGYQTVYKYNVSNNTFSTETVTANEKTLVSVKGDANEKVGIRTSIGYDSSSENLFMQILKNDPVSNNSKLSELIRYNTLGTTKIVKIPDSFS